MRIHINYLIILFCALIELSACQTRQAADSNPNPEQGARASRSDPGSGESAPPAAAPADGHPAMASILSEPWRLTYSARCEGVSPEKCAGYHGFAVTSDGQYVLGPGPNGQTLKGWLSAEDYALLRGELTHLNLPSGTQEIPEGERCSEEEKRPEDGERFALEYRKNCLNPATLKSKERRGAFRETLSELARKYSPESFPNPCIDASQSLESAYEEARTCRSDSDCAYMDEGFFPIERSASREVVVDDCTYVRPIAVGSTFGVIAAQRDLILLHEAIRSKCGEGLDRGNCKTKIGFHAEKAPAPVCLAGRCRIPSGLHMH